MELGVVHDAESPKALRGIFMS